MEKKRKMGIVFILFGIYINETMLPVGVKTKDEKVTFSTEKWFLILTVTLLG